MHVENKQECTGCGACYNVCPKNAITMEMNSKGFYSPVIDGEKCVDCGLCDKICPLDKYKSQNIEQPRAFAFQNSDEETLYKCASGGAFAYFAKNVTDSGGIVYGVVYDENLVVCHTRADNLKDLEKMYSSKYVQSDTRGTLKSAKADLQDGKTVLYSGTPCQIAGLKSYLGKDYNNLITVDLVCHGVPSPLVFERYKSEITKKLRKNEQILNIDFRSKINGWSGLLYTTIFTNKRLFHISMYKDNLMRAFLGNIILNKSCSDCKFNKIPRVADITLADFWGADNYDVTLNNKKGLSVILINTEKGHELIKNVEKTCLIKEVPLDVIIKYNKNISGSSVPNVKRDEFLEDIKKGKSLKSCVQKYMDDPLYIKLYRILPQFLKNFIKYKILKR